MFVTVLCVLHFLNFNLEPNIITRNRSARVHTGYRIGNEHNGKKQ
jgi:hypothetical protein